MVVANDGVLANYGIGAEHPGVVACSIGTSGAVCKVVAQPQINNGGVALGWVRDVLLSDLKAAAKEQGRDPYELIEDLAGEVPAGSEGVIFLPYLTGERAPQWNADASAGVLRPDPRTPAGAPAPGRDEGVIYQMHSVERALAEMAGEPQEIRATGGFARSSLWCQIMADVFGREGLLPESYESSCWGLRSWVCTPSVCTPSASYTH